MNSFVIVGGEDCPTHNVHKILRFSPSFHLFQEKWSDVARDLDIPEVDIKAIRGDMLLNKISLSDALKQILDLWVGGSGNAASLERLVQSLEDNELIDCGQRLGKELKLCYNQKKYCCIPMALDSLLNSTEFPSGLIVCTTLDVAITMEKIRENLLNCQVFLNYESLLSIVSTGNEWRILVVTDDDPNTLANLLANMSGNKPFDENGKIVFVTNEKEKNVQEVLRKRQLSNTCVRIVKDEMKWNDLNLVTKHGVRKRAEEYVGFRIENELVESVLSGQVLTDLINGKQYLHIIKATLPEPCSYYVKRNLLTRSIILEDVFKTSREGVFVFQEITRSELSAMIRGALTANSSEQLQTVTSRFIVLDQQNHFTKICQLVNDPVHLVRKEVDGKWIWIKTKGTIRNIQEHVLERDAQINVDEDAFVTTMCERTFEENIPVCISDSPGMGKSYLLGQIGRNLQCIFSERIVVFVVLPEFIKEVVRTICNNNLETAVKSSLKKFSRKNHLGELYLESKLNEEDKIWIELLLDGFDEVDYYNRSLSHQVLNTLKCFKSVRLWVSSRPHLLEELEETLNVLGYNVQPFCEENQIHFLTRFWGERLEMPYDKFKHFASLCLQGLKKNINSSDEDIAGIPLQCLMVAEIFQDEAKANAGLSTEAFWTETFTFIDLYDLLIKKKIELYFKKYKTGDKLTQAKILDMHKWLSLQLLFPDYAEKLLEMSAVTSKYMDEILRIGLLEVSKSVISPRFVHRTLAEYLIAVFAIEVLRYQGSQGKDFNSLLYDHLLSNKPPSKKNLTIWKVMDYALDNFRGFLHPVICHFLNYLIPREGRVDLPISKHLSQFSTVQLMILACVTHSFTHIFQLLSDNQVVKKFERFLFNKDLLFAAVRFANLDLIRIVFAHFNKYYDFTEEAKKEVLIIAISYKTKFSVVEFLLKEKGCEALLNGHYVAKIIRVLLHSVSFTHKMTPLSVERHIDIIRVLLSNRVARRHLEGLVLQHKVHIKIIIELINLGANLLEIDIGEKTILHNAPKWLNYLEYEHLIQNIPTEMLRQLASIRNNSECFLLNNILEEIDPSFPTLKCVINAGAALNSYGKFEQSALSTATKFGRSSETLRNLVKLGADVNWIGENGESLLHLATKHGNVEGVIYFVNELGFNVNITDSNWMTPIDYSAKILHGAQNTKIENFLGERGGLSNIAHFYTRLKLEMSFKELGSVIKQMLKCVRNNKVKYLRDMLSQKSDLEVKNLLITTWIKVSGSNSILDWIDRIIKCGASSVDIINNLVKNGADAFEKDTKGRNFLHLLLNREVWEIQITPSTFHKICEHLVAHKPTLLLSMTETCHGYAPLHLAVKNIEVEERTLQLLCNTNVLLDQIDKDGNNLLVYAIKGMRSYELLTNLIKFGVDWKCRNLAGWNLLHHSVINGNIVGLKLFLKLGLSPNDVNNKRQSSLTLCVANLVPEDTVLSILFYALDSPYNNKVEALKYLIAKGADLYAKDEKNRTFIHKWISKTNISPGQFHEFVECLIQNNLCSALEVGGFEDNCTPFHVAINEIEVSEQTLNLLHSVGVIFNSKDKNGNSILTYAIWGKRSLNLIDTLIKYGADAFHLDKNGRNLIHSAAQYGSAESLWFFIKKATFEIEEVEHGEKDIGQYQAGLDVNKKDYDGNTPLHSAMLTEDVKGLEEKISFLLEAGADASIRNNEGLYPFDILMQWDDLDEDIKNTLVRCLNN